MFVKYITIYDGDKLPPLHIRSTSARMIEAGYKGSVRGVQYRDTWKQELKDNPQLFDTIILSERTTFEDALVEEHCLHTKHDVACNSLFINTATAWGGFINHGYWTEQEKQRMRIPQGFMAEA